MAPFAGASLGTIKFSKKQVHYLPFMNDSCTLITPSHFFSENHLKEQSDGAANNLPETFVKSDVSVRAIAEINYGGGPIVVAEEMTRVQYLQSF